MKHQQGQTLGMLRVCCWVGGKIDGKIGVEVYCEEHAPEQQHRPPSLRRLAEAGIFGQVLSRRHGPVAAGSVPPAIATRQHTAHSTQHQHTAAHIIIHHSTSIMPHQNAAGFIRTGTKIVAKRRDLLEPEQR